MSVWISAVPKQMRELICCRQDRIFYSQVTFRVCTYAGERRPPNWSLPPMPRRAAMTTLLLPSSIAGASAAEERIYDRFGVGGQGAVQGCSYWLILIYVF